MNQRIQATIAAVVLAAALTFSLPAQQGGVGTGGAVRLLQQQRLQGSWRRVLMIGAHPDDEDTELLTILARGEGITTGYLSLTRGDGGQNLIGPELGEALGVLRTEELASARAIDGGNQFFTRAFDFGFSKTAEESLRFWNRDSLLKDMVRVIRRFRPQVIVSVWSGTPSDGHGHHQASGILALEAYHAAGDPSRFPELRQEGLAPYQVSKYYRSAGRGAQANATLTFDGGVIDPATGLSLHQLAVRSRSQHRSQNQGNLEELGPSRTGVRLVERRAGLSGSDDSLFDGIPVESMAGMDAHAVEATLTARQLVLDATVDDNEVTPGQQLPLTFRAWNRGQDSVRISFGVSLAAGFTIEHGDCPEAGARVAPGILFTCRATLVVARDAAPTAPYYLRLPRIGAMYQWSGPASVWGEPSAPPMTADFGVTWNGAGPTPITATREVQDRLRDPVLGEVRRPVMIVPAVAVSLEPNHLLWPAGVRSRSFTVALDHLARDTMDARVSLAVPAGWSTGPAQSVHFSREDERAVVTFQVIAPLRVVGGTYQIEARAVAGRDTFSTGIQRIRYPHIRDRNLVTHAEGEAVVAPVIFPALGSIGYVRGGGDLVPEALTDAGLKVVLLTGDALERGSLDRFKVIVIGPRAYEADASLVRAHPRLMRWLAAGGTLIVQYEQTPYVRGGFPPKPFTLVSPTQSRVTDENATVTILAKTHQAVRWPNVIGAADFDGWVQERGLDYPPTHDPAWTPILSMHDAGEPPLDGALLVARVGKGTAVYTGLSFHRQLPAVVPGAWRLFANLLGLGQSTVKP